MESTSSFRYLDWNLQHQLKELYVNYFFRRQDAFWKKEAMKKLPAAEKINQYAGLRRRPGHGAGLCAGRHETDLAFSAWKSSACPRISTRDFFHPADAPYLSVVTPSTHDMSTIRGWWEEDRSYNPEIL